MAISINWLTKVISVPQVDLTPKGGGVYELDVDWMRLSLKAIEYAVDGMPFLDTHRHNTQVVLSGVIYARIVEIINGYTVEFENGQYTVVCKGANHNLADVKVVNSVSLIIGNAAGLIVVETGTSGLTPSESAALLNIESDIGSIDATQQAMALDLARALGLAQENYFMDQTQYNLDGRLTSARIRIYSLAGSVGTASNVIATYTVTATWSGTTLLTYKVVKSA